MKRSKPSASSANLSNGRDHDTTLKEENTNIHTESSNKARKLNDTYDERSTNCPYLYTINRKALNFDDAKICSVTMNKVNIYCCLICGEFLQGRGKQSPANVHSLEMGHYLYMNVESGQVFCLPDNYEVHNSTLSDIKNALLPKYLPSDIVSLESRSLETRQTFHGDTDIPGYMGLNNLGCTDSINCIVQILSILSPVRNCLLLFSNTDTVSDKDTGKINSKNKIKIKQQTQTRMRKRNLKIDR